MFAMIDGMPDNVVAVRGTGRIRGEDYKDVLDPAIEHAASGGRKLRLYLELGEGFEGYDPSGMLADSTLGMSHLSTFERIAVVTDADWLKHAIHLFGPLIPGEVRVLPVAEAAAARQWVAA